MSKAKKQILSLILSLLMVFSLAACGGEPSDTSGEGASAEETFPTKQVKIICPWGVGGGVDVIARKVASFGEKYLGQPVIVENKTGGAGTIAMTTLVQEPDDGYTLIAANGPLFSLTPNFQKIQYKLEDITPLVGMRSVEFVALTNPSKSGLSTLDDLKKYAEEGNIIKYATTGGPGNDSYTMIAVLFKKLGIEAEAVPFDGGLDAINALVGGHVDVSIGSPPAYIEHVKAGTLVSLGTFAPYTVKIDGIPDQIPFKEQGIDAEFLGMDYFAVRSSVDSEKQEILTEFVKNVYSDPEFQEFMIEMNMEAFEVTGDEIFSIIEDQTVDMTEYITLIK